MVNKEITNENIRKAIRDKCNEGGRITREKLYDYLNWEVDKQFLELLNHSFGTDDNSWKPHRKLLVKAQKGDYNEIKKILRNAQKAKNQVEYTVNAFKKIKKVEQDVRSCS